MALFEHGMIVEVSVSRREYASNRQSVHCSQVFLIVEANLHLLRLDCLYHRGFSPLPANNFGRNRNSERIR